MIRKMLKWIMIGVFILIVIGTVDFLIWRGQMAIALEANSQVIQTSRGPVEYTMQGSGPAVLLLHGTIGGYDQSQLLTSLLKGSQNTVIAVSRPGYLRTPLSSGATFEGQADAYAALLEALGIKKAAVIAISGGGPSALEFALRYPERCWALVMIAANSDVNAGKNIENAPGQATPPPLWLTNLMFSDVTSWALIRFGHLMPGKLLDPLIGKAYTPAILNDPRQYQTYLKFLNSLSLLSRRKAGTFNDGSQFLKFTGNPIEKINCPVLILYGTKDVFMNRGEQNYLRNTLPNNQYIEIEGGTHFMPVSHAAVMSPLVTDFLNGHAP